jgi:hypothetical protein
MIELSSLTKASLPPIEARPKTERRAFFEVSEYMVETSIQIDDLCIYWT